MADILRQLLDCGKLSDETCHSILCGLGQHVDALHLSKTEEEVDGWTSEEDEELDQEYCRQVTESLVLFSCLCFDLVFRFCLSWKAFVFLIKILIK